MLRNWKSIAVLAVIAVATLGADALPGALTRDPVGAAPPPAIIVQASLPDAEPGVIAPEPICERVGAAWFCDVDPLTLNVARDSQGSQAAHAERLAAIREAKRKVYETEKASAPTGGPIAARLAPLRNSEVAAVLAKAGVPEEWHAELEAIAWCESRWRADAVGDNGNSVGMFQMWTGWFSKAGEDLGQWSDPVVNARVAKYVREVRGRFGGGGGWSCADHLGIP